MGTPRTWPEGTVPTAEQLRDWLLSAEPDEQLAVCAHMLHDAQIAATCYAANHAGIIETLERLEERMDELRERDFHADVAMWRARAHRYRNAWRSARRRDRAVKAALASVLDAYLGQVLGATARSAIAHGPVTITAGNFTLVLGLNDITRPGPPSLPGLLPDPVVPTS